MKSPVLVPQMPAQERPARIFYSPSTALPPRGCCGPRSPSRGGCASTRCIYIPDNLLLTRKKIVLDTQCVQQALKNSECRRIWPRANEARACSLERATPPRNSDKLLVEPPSVHVQNCIHRKYRYSRSSLLPCSSSTDCVVSRYHDLSYGGTCMIAGRPGGSSG